MPRPVGFQLFIAYPPDREGRVVELHVRCDDQVDIPAEVYRDGDQTMITLFSHSDGFASTYPLVDFVAAVNAASAALDAPARSEPSPRDLFGDVGATTTESRRTSANEVEFPDDGEIRIGWSVSNIGDDRRMSWAYSSDR